MAQPVSQTIREALLSEVKRQDPSNRQNRQGQQSLSEQPILDAMQQKFGRGMHDELILTEWHDLFRTGVLAWGLNLTNPGHPFFHPTERGRKALEHLTRNPNNPTGYLRHLASIATVNPIALSYLKEGIDCYVAGLFKAAAVMIGGASESIIIELRDGTVQKLQANSQTIPKHLNAWQTKTIADVLQGFFDGHKQDFSHELRGLYEANWTPFIHLIRVTRNDAGHPMDIDPVSEDTVHASLLVFPELARVATGLLHWINNDL